MSVNGEWVRSVLYARTVHEDTEVAGTNTMISRLRAGCGMTTQLPIVVFDTCVLIGMLTRDPQYASAGQYDADRKVGQLVIAVSEITIAEACKLTSKSGQYQHEAVAKYFDDTTSTRRFRPAYRWAGTFAQTQDGLPYIGEHPRWPGVWFALGYGGNGITFSVLAAKIITAAVSGTPHPAARLFRFDRERPR